MTLPPHHFLCFADCHVNTCIYYMLASFQWKKDSTKLWNHKIILEEIWVGVKQFFGQLSIDFFHFLSGLLD